MLKDKIKIYELKSKTDVWMQKKKFWIIKYVYLPIYKNVFFWSFIWLCFYLQVSNPSVGPEPINLRVEA